MSSVHNPFSEPYRYKNFKVYGGYYTSYCQNTASSDFQVLFVHTNDVKPDIYGGVGMTDFFVMECCTGGHSTMTVDNNVFELKEGDCYVTYPQSMVSQQTHPDSHASYAWFGFIGFKAEYLLRQLGITPERPFVDKRAFPFILNTILAMHADFQEDNLSNQLFQTAQVNLIFAKLFSLYDSTENKSSYSSHIKKAIAYIEQHFSEAITIADLSSQIGLDRSYLFEIFKKNTGFSPQDYLIHFRIRQACSLLLKSPELPVSEVANLVGYHATNFMRTFKKITGMTPTEYRNAYALKKQSL